MRVSYTHSTYVLFLYPSGIHMIISIYVYISSYTLYHHIHSFPYYASHTISSLNASCTNILCICENALLLYLYMYLLLSYAVIHM